MLYKILILTICLFTAGQTQASEKSVVIFKGKTICDGCETPFVDLFQKRGYKIHLVKPDESTVTLLKDAALYITPGGDDVTNLDDGWSASDLKNIRDYVRNGGRYYGACLGAYWAGKTGTYAGTISGFESLDIIPATVLELSPQNKNPMIMGIHWLGTARKVYFQDGPSFNITDSSKILKLYATYDVDGSAAAFISQYGQGKVGISGVHTEATQDWYDEDHLVAPQGLTPDLFKQIIDDLMQ